MKFIITVDTEADNQWKAKDLKLDNIDYLPRFQSLCEKYEFKPTYLLSYEVVASNKIASLKKWQDNGLAEIGAHLHPWSTPPYEDNNNQKIHTYPHELENQLLFDKLKNLTDLISQKFEQAPISFRAGRWGFADNVAKNLKLLDYKIDCSITPKIDWSKTLGDPDKNGGPDFRFSPVVPHDLDGLLEVPMTILFTGVCKKENSFCSKIFLKLPDGLIKKVVNKIFFRQKWLRAFHNSNNKDWELIYNSARKNNLPVLEFMIHSSELMVGGSPYSKTEEQLERVYKQIENMFSYFKNKGLEGCCLKDLVK